MKAIRFLAITVLSALIFTACNKDDYGIDPITGGGEIVFNIGIAPQVETRVATDAEFKSTWEDGDEIGIFAVKRAASNTAATLQSTGNYIHNVKLTYNSTDGKWTAASELWHAPGSEVLDFYAYYPYDGNGNSPEMLDPLSITFNVNTDQTTAANYNTSDLLSAEKVTGIAKGTAVNLQFTHMLSLVQVEVDPTYIDRNGGFTTTLRGCKAGGAFNLGTGNLTIDGSAQPQTVKMLRVEQPSDADYATKYTYRALVPAQSVVSGTSLCLMAQNEQLFSTPKLPAALKLSAGNAKLYTATLPVTALATVAIKNGTFQMGSPDNEPNRSTNETQHEVTLTKDFYMSKYAITNAQYANFLNAVGVGSNGKWLKGKYPNEILVLSSVPNPGFSNYNWGLNWDAGTSSWIPASGYEHHPVIYVSWYGATEFATWVGGSLPTEAQWEYACRGDYEDKATEVATQPFGLGDGSKLYADMANFNGEYPYELPDGNISNFTGTPTNNEKTMPVGSYAANNYGLYDMHGNVWEWCSDWFNADYAESGTAINDIYTDPTGVANGSHRVLRGGSWHDYAQDCRSAFRAFIKPSNWYSNIGFRVVFVP